METLYGKYPKRITCECNAEEMNEEAITIRLNDRCPICNKLHQVCVTKPEVKVKQLQEKTYEEQPVQHTVFVITKAKTVRFTELPGTNAS